MLTEERDGSAERRLLLAAAVSPEFLARLAGRLGFDPLRSRHGNVMLGWCLKHYADHHAAPGRAVEAHARDWAKADKDKETQEAMARLLASLSGELERAGLADLSFAVADAQRHLNEVLLERHAEQLRQFMARGDVAEALEAQHKFRPVDLTTPAGTDVLADSEAHRRALENKARVLVRFPGAAGRFFGEEFAEDSLVAFMAPPKSTKSYNLLNVAWHAMRQGRRVAYFQVGDLSADQIMRRFLKRGLRRPLDARVVKYPRGIAVPGQAGKVLAAVDHEVMEFTKPATLPDVARAFKDLTAKYAGNLRLVHAPIKTISMLDVKAMLEAWARAGWPAKVVVIDYPENMKAPEKGMDRLDTIAETWALGRQVSELHKCCVVVASQTNKEGFKTWVLTKANFRGNLMTLAHVTAFYGINATDEEKHGGVMRINCVVRREEDFDETECLFCAPCLDVADVCVQSTLLRT